MPHVRETVSARAEPSRVDQIDALLPQTQCRRCGYSGCRPYAEAIAAGAAPINRCPPGGAAGITRLARLLDQPEIQLDPTCGSEAPRAVARIEPELCIGCTKCIRACPVDAIIGASKRMHTVIAELCTGCDLCVPPCPVDCIVIEPLAQSAAEPWSDADAHAARTRHLARARRLERVAVERDERLAGRARAKLDALASEPADALADRKRAIIEAAMARARDRVAERAARRSAANEGTSEDDHKAADKPTQSVVTASPTDPTEIRSTVSGAQPPARPPLAGRQAQ